jgi:2-C-methyl-D-erythritol 4-phosphate cytidylyltransferase
MKTVAIIVAGGRGKRMGRPKQFIKIAGKPMLEWTVGAFQRSKVIDGIILVVAKEQMPLTNKLKFSKILKIVAGGKERQDSVRSGLEALPGTAEIVAIHDGARPMVTPGLIEDSIKAAKKYGAAIVGVPVKDTVKVASRKELVVNRTVDRSGLWAAQTPQTFKVSVIKKAYANLKEIVTDDAMAVEKAGFPVKMVRGSYKNIKITTPEDLITGEAFLRKEK